MSEIQRLRAYHHQWSRVDRMKARGEGIFIDNGEAWRYEHTDTDDFGKYDLWSRSPSVLSTSGGPAFPVPDTDEAQESYLGMTLRDWFAGQALQGLYGGRAGAYVDTAQVSLRADADLAYALADAMLAAREAK